MREVIANKIVPIQGDISLPGLGLNEHDTKMITENIDCLINVAATIDFNMPLRWSIPINIGGAKQNLLLSKKCKKLQVYCHVSTAYTNSEKPSGSRIKEEVYGTGVDAEQFIDSIFAMSDEQLEKDTPKILGSFPNTYTFTKSYAERILQKNRGNVPVVVVRPSIIGSSQSEPAPGWVDSLAAAASYVHSLGTGMANHMSGNGDVVFDVIPVDFVCNAILLATAFQANKDHF